MLVKRVHKLAWSVDNWNYFQWALRVTTEGDAHEMEQYIIKNVREAAQLSAEKRRVSEQFFRSGAKTLLQTTELTPWRGGAALVRTLAEDEERARVTTNFDDWARHWQVKQVAQKQERPWKDLELRKQEKALAPLRWKS